MPSLRRAIVRIAHLVLLFLVGTSGAYAETITGTVTNTVPAALPNVTVEAFDTATGSPVATTLTDAAGAYTLTLPAGSYFVRTFNTAHYINQLYHSAGNLQCVGLCNLNVGTAVDVPPGGAIAGINFMLAIGATITGTVRDEDTGLPLEGIRVEIVLPAGNLFVDDAVTAADGTYSTSNGFPSGPYFPVTDDNSQGYINESFGGAPCLPWPVCSKRSATSVAVVAGAVRANVDFALRRGGRYSGHVRDAVTGLGLGGVEVRVLNAASENYGRVFTNAAGEFTTGRGLPTGSYFLRTFNTAGYINTFNDGTVCVGSCSVATIEPIPVTQPDTISGVDFLLDAGGRVAGTVRDATTLEPLPNVDVQIGASTGGGVLTTGFTDASGNYVSSDGLPTGTYVVRTASISVNALGGYIHKLYDNVTCAAGCTPTLGAPVAVAAGSTTSFIDFDLERGGQVTGTLRDAATGLGISSPTVTVFNAVGTVLSTGLADTAGRYLTVAGLIPGSYFLRVTNGVGYVNEVYPDVVCLGNICPPGSGSLVAVDANSVTTVDMDLVRGSRFRGTILDSSGAVVTGATVAVLDASGQTLTTTGTVDALGAYLTGPGFPAGFYYARTNNSVGYINELYPDVACHFGCAVATGTPIPLSGGNVTTTNINFTLDLGGQVTGHVTNEGTGLPLANVTVSLFNPVTQTSISATTDSTGEYVVRGLPDGVYYARTTNTLGYVNEAFDNIACVFACSNTTLGQPLVVAAAGTLTGVDFELRAGGRVSGKVIDAATSLPLSGVTVSIVEPTGATVATATSDLSGNYVTGAGILSGNYFATTGNSAGYQNELYDDIRCNGPCTIAAGASFAVTEGATTPGIDFSLDRGGRVSGQVTDATGTPLQGVTVAVLDSSGRQVATATSDAGGNYITGAGVSAGTYYARTTNAIGFVDELYDNRPCPTGCPIVGGTTFGVAAGSTTPGIHFALARGGRIAGVVTNESTGQPLGSVTVQIFDATAQLFTTAVTNAFGVYTSNAGLPSGTYYARTVNSLGYLNELFGGLPCAAGCLVTGGTPIVVASPAATTARDFALSPGGRVAGRVTDTSGAPLRNVTVSIRDATGTSLVTGITNAAGDYITAQGLPTGDYFVRTTNALGYINQLHASPSPIPCVGNCDVTAGTLVHVDLGATTMDIDFALEAGARVRGIVTRTDGTPIPNVTVSVVNALGLQVAAGVTDGTGTYVTGTGFPTGNYFAVTQNTQGFVNKIFDNIPCVGSCTPTTGTAILAAAGTTTPLIDFVLEPDTDPDLDGIAATVDTLPAAFSNDFTDVPLGGTTSGTISRRSGWAALVGDVTPGGVQLQVVGPGAGAARFDVCPLGGPEFATLDVLGEIASVSCDPVTGSTTISALAATPIIELRDLSGRLGLIALLTTGQGVTMGSPVTASSTNTQSISVLFIDADGVPFGSFDLDPGESVDARVNSDGSVDATVLQGTITITVRGEAVTLQAGDGHAFPPIEVQIAIDIKPGDSATNPINLNSNGVIPVAILSDARFDATTANPASLRLSGASVRTRRGAFHMSVVDVNADGRLDIVVHFETQGLLLTPADRVGVVTGQTANGLLFRGIDAVRVQ